MGYCAVGLPLLIPTRCIRHSELRHQLQDSGAETIIIAENFAHVLQEILHETPIKRVIVTSVGDCLGSFKGWLVNQVVRHIKKGVPAWSLPGAISFKTVLAKGRTRPPGPGHTHT